MSIKPLPKTIGMNIKLVIKKTHPDTTPIASGLKIMTQSNKNKTTPFKFDFPWYYSIVGTRV